MLIKRSRTSVPEASQQQQPIEMIIIINSVFRVTPTAHVIIMQYAPSWKKIDPCHWDTNTDHSNG